jgi:hypothetical protein
MFTMQITKVIKEKKVRGEIWGVFMSQDKMIFGKYEYCSVDEKTIIFIKSLAEGLILLDKLN